MFLTPKENYLRSLRHEKPEYVPFSFAESCLVGMELPMDKGPPGGGIDGFGVNWIATASGGGGAVPDSSHFILDDITQWKKKVTIPDPNAEDWESLAQMQMPQLNRDTTPVVVMSGACPWDRVVTLLGYEEALYSLAAEPEATYELLTVLADLKIEVIKKYAQYFKPDVFIYADDIATERNLFMSPDTYRKLIKPQHKRLVDTIKNCGMIPVQHTCGRAEDIVEDIIEIGAAAWNSVQPRNDITGLLKKYGSKFCFDGGFDSNGPPSYESAPPEVVEEEVRRCFREYGPHEGFQFMGSSMINTLDPAAFGESMIAMYNIYLKVRDGK
jgi:hypothetical protein